MRAWLIPPPTASPATIQSKMIGEDVAYEVTIMMAPKAGLDEEFLPCSSSDGGK